MHRFRRSGRFLRNCCFALALSSVAWARANAATAPFPEFPDPHPAEGNSFGHSIVTLSNGNVVITAPLDDASGVDAGAVYVFNGGTGALLAKYQGASDNDQIGSAGIVALRTGNFLILSPNYDNGATADAGAVTFCNGTSTSNGFVLTSNSLVGSAANDRIGSATSVVTLLTNGNYVVRSTSATISGVVGAGAVTWGSGTSGVTGLLGSANSLVGTSTSDNVGSSGLVALTNGNYVVASANWDNGAVTNVGAVTWGNGALGVKGAVSTANSLVGSTAGDAVGISGVVALTNGNYVVRSPGWDNGAATGAGAVTWGNGATGVSGTVSAANSLVGSTAGDELGSSGVFALTNGNCVVSSPNWDNGAVANAGAVTWMNGTVGAVGTISSLNSLLGSTVSDLVGNGGVRVLTNGNYVVLSQNWDSGAVVDAGAATWGNGGSGVKGVLSSANSLIGSTADDAVGSGGAAALANGNYVVLSGTWTNGAAAAAGAATWGSGTAGVKGVLSAANSLVGSTASDGVSLGVLPLTNGNYVVRMPSWDNGPVVDAGAAVFGNGTLGTKGVVSSAFALVGTTTADRVGSAATALANGNYVVQSSSWNNGSAADAGAVTWCSGTTGLAGSVSPANSLVGSTTIDHVGNAITALPNGNYLVGSLNWDDGAVVNAGAITFCNGATGLAGPLSAANSLVGSTTSDLLGNGSATVLSDGSAAYMIGNYDNGSLVNAGAVVWFDGSTPLTGRLDGKAVVYGLAASTSLSVLVADSVHATFCARFFGEEGGRVRVGPPVAFQVADLADVPADQGGWLYLQYARQANDHPLATTPVTTYGIWRQIPPGTLAPVARPAGLAAGTPLDDALRAFATTLPATLGVTVSGGQLVARSAPTSGAAPATALPAGSWALVQTAPAMQQASYTVLVPAISNQVTSTYCVTAHTSRPAAWFVTTTVSGHSVDNLAPASPQSFAGNYAAGATHLTWAPNGEGDLHHYDLYRGGSAGFTPSPGNRIASPAGTTFDDPTPGAFVYKLTAVDENGNESPVATATPAGVTVVEAGPIAFALDGARPNPAAGRALRVSFALPSGVPARLELLDVSGRRVAVREVGSLGAGRHVVDLADSHRVSAGLYWLRLTQGAAHATVRVAVVD
jgi:hypothetical protein